MAATIIIPTRGRPNYLEVTLGSVAPQAAEAGAELLIVDDSADAATVRIAARHGVSVISTGGDRGANAARNAGVAAVSRGSLAAASAASAYGSASLNRRIPPRSAAVPSWTSARK